MNKYLMVVALLLLGSLTPLAHAQTPTPPSPGKVLPLLATAMTDPYDYIEIVWQNANLTSVSQIAFVQLDDGRGPVVLPLYPAGQTCYVGGCNYFWTWSGYPLPDRCGTFSIVAGVIPTSEGYVNVDLSRATPLTFPCSVFIAYVGG